MNLPANKYHSFVDKLLLEPREVACWVYADGIILHAALDVIRQLV
jgi:hypothetical protein